MRFLYFKQLSMPAKARLICSRVVHLTERTEGGYIIALYALGDFYVEVHHRAADSEVVMISNFYNTALPEPYLQKNPLASCCKPCITVARVRRRDWGNRK